MALKVSCWTSFLLLDDSPNHETKWPLAETPVGSSGVSVIVPSAVPVTQNSSRPGAVNAVTWKTSLVAIAVIVPGSPVHGFVDGFENRTSFWPCWVKVIVPGGLPAEAATADMSAAAAAKHAAGNRRLNIRCSRLIE